MPATLSKAIPGPVCRQLLFFSSVLWRRRADRRRRAGDRGEYRRHHHRAGRHRPGHHRRSRGNRRDCDAARREHQQGADQHHGVQPGVARPEGDPRSDRARALHPRRLDRHHRHQSDLDPRHLILRRRGHHRHLHRRYADPDARARLQSRRDAAEDLRSRSRRGAARSSRNLVRIRLRGRHHPLHHDATEREPGIDVPAQRGRRIRNTASPAARRASRTAARSSTAFSAIA